MSTSADRLIALERELLALRAEHEQLRRQAEDVATANVHAAMQMVDMYADRERALAAKHHEVEAALVRAEEASQQKSRFLANMSHELRTPLAGIRGLAELLRDGPLTPVQSDHVDAIVRTADGFLELVHQLLDIAKIEAGKLELEEVDLDLWEILEDAAQQLQVGADVKHLHTDFTIAPDVPRHVIGDPLRLRQILQNLCSNAVKFTAAGHVYLRAHNVGTPSCPRVRVAVADTGCGISATAAERLFQPFVQADASTTRRFGGTGLGLAIARQLAQRMGGDLVFASEPGAGTTFTLELPIQADGRQRPAPPRRRVAVWAATAAAASQLVAHLAHAGHQTIAVDEFADLRDAAAEVLALCAAADGADERCALLDLFAGAPPPTVLFVHGGSAVAPADLAPRLAVLERPLRPTRLLRAVEEVATARPAGPPRAAPADLAGMRVLVAEDTAVSRRVIEAQLRRLGCSALCVADGQEAVAAMQREPFELVLMDCHMPVLDGYGATAAIRLREAQLARRTPIIALTANAVAGHREQCLAIGMDDHVLKPVRLPELEATLRRWRAAAVGSV